MGGCKAGIAGKINSDLNENYTLKVFIKPEAKLKAYS